MGSDVLIKVCNASGNILIISKVSEKQHRKWSFIIHINETVDGSTCLISKTSLNIY